MEKHEVIASLVDSLRPRFGERIFEIKKHILDREELISTGIGKEIAIPHARCSFVDDFIFVLGINKGMGILWDSIDEEPVKIICLVVGPDDSPCKYLEFLSSVTTILHDDELKNKILQYEDKKNIVNIFGD